MLSQTKKKSSKNQTIRKPARDAEVFSINDELEEDMADDKVGGNFFFDAA